MRLYRSGVKHFNHPLVGTLDLDLDLDAMDLPGEPGLALTAYTAQPDPPSHDALTLLATWTATTTAETSDTGSHQHTH